MAQVAVVTDSTAYLPADLVQGHGVSAPGEPGARVAALPLQVVPLQVVVGGMSHDEGSEITPADVADALRRYVPVSTSRPTPHAFLAAYERAAAAGAHEVVSVHISADMSGTIESASIAAREAPVPVHVVDSRSMAMGLGFAVLSAVEAAAEGASGAEVAAVAEKRALATSGLFYVDTLEHLRRGGRIGAAQALLGSALAVKPLLELLDGRIVPLEKVRTASRALARLEDLAVERAGTGAVDLAVHHLASPERAAALAERLRERVPGLHDLRLAEVGAVVGAHVGPGMLGVVVAPR
ncbi:MAG TPA: DegV family protein [Motilibacteraceae bacterium]|nr:DegV family protein [Motilibacteraceae bacterium]